MEYYYSLNGQQLGPIDESQLVAAGVTFDTPVWCETMEAWAPAGEVPALAAMFPAQDPTPVQTAYSAPANDAKWFFEVESANEMHDAQQIGPITLEQITQMKEFEEDKKVWCEGMPTWVEIKYVPDFKEALKEKKKKDRKKFLIYAILCLLALMFVAAMK
ncbi:MAG: DUF4339 domain-containing protein [Muribaculaceae bacterium]|nr:DUF4339 domain-containing protein [Muribaculaceae bacterium]